MSAARPLRLSIVNRTGGHYSRRPEPIDSKYIFKLTARLVDRNNFARGELTAYTTAIDQFDTVAQDLFKKASAQASRYPSHEHVRGPALLENILVTLLPDQVDCDTISIGFNEFATPLEGDDAPAIDAEDGK